MKYQTTSYERFGVIKEIDHLQCRCEVIGDEDIIYFAREHMPHLVSIDEHRAYTSSPESLAEYESKIKGSFNHYKLIFIPAEVMIK